MEIALPFRAFGDDARRRVWGVNFARFATQGAEASSWTEARGYFYDPAQLGTMLVEGP